VPRLETSAGLKMARWGRRRDFCYREERKGKNALCHAWVA
jgi:hypothetical protein